MQSGSKLTLVCGALAALVVSLAPVAPHVIADSSSSTSAASTSSADQLRAQRADLVKQLATAAGARDDAKHQLIAAQAELQKAESALNDTRARLDSIDARLKTLNDEITTQSSGLESAKVQLAGLVRMAYESSDKDGFANAVLSSGSFGEAMDRVRAAQSITDQVVVLKDTVAGKEHALIDARSKLQTDFAAAQSLESTLNDQTGRFMAMVAQRDEAFHNLQGPARTLASQIAAIDDQLAPKAAPVIAGPVDDSKPCGNRFAYGNCTYYVATRRCIPWLGNAYEWYSAAARAGYAEGQTPRRGAVVVWGRGGSSPVGHVAYVEAVGPDGGVPAGSFLISEMNYKGWNVVSYRTVKIGAGYLGFIYGKAG